MHGLAEISRQAADGKVRVTVAQNLVLGFIPVANLPRVYAALKNLNLAGSDASRIEDITTCPGAWTCNLGITKSMTLGAALQQTVSKYTDPGIQALQIKISGCPNRAASTGSRTSGFTGTLGRSAGASCRITR